MKHSIRRNTPVSIIRMEHVYNLSLREWTPALQKEIETLSIWEYEMYLLLKDAFEEGRRSAESY